MPSESSPFSLSSWISRPTMPTASVGHDRLFAALGRTYSEHPRSPTSLHSLIRFVILFSYICFAEFAAQEEFEDLCFRFGIELDDAVRERVFYCLVLCSSMLTSEVLVHLS